MTAIAAAVLALTAVVVAQTAEDFSAKFPSIKVQNT